MNEEQRQTLLGIAVTLNMAVIPPDETEFRGGERITLAIDRPDVQGLLIFSYPTYGPRKGRLAVDFAFRGYGKHDLHSAYFGNGLPADREKLSITMTDPVGKPVGAIAKTIERRLMFAAARAYAKAVRYDEARNDRASKRLAHAAEIVRIDQAWSADTHQTDRDEVTLSMHSKVTPEGATHYGSMKITATYARIELRTDPDMAKAIARAVREEIERRQAPRLAVAA